MSELTPTSEIPQYNREQVVEVFKGFAEGGITNPDDLSLTDPKVTKAHNVLDVWTKQARDEAQRKGTPEANLDFTLKRSTIFTDAGFSDPDYLDEVAHDWLAQDLQEAEDVGLTELAIRIRAKIDQIEAKLTH